MADPTLINAQRPVSSGLNTVFTSVDAANGNKFANTGRTIVTVKNANGAASVTINIPVPNKVDGSLAVADRQPQAANVNTSVEIGRLSTQVYNDSLGYVTIKFSSGTNISMSVIEP